MAWLSKNRRTNPRTGRRETYYNIVSRAEGKTATVSIGFCSTQDAQRALKSFERRQLLGLPLEDARPSAEPTPAPTAKGVVSLTVYLEETYLPVVRRDKRPNTWRVARDAASALKKALGSFPLDQIDYARIDAHVSARRAAGRSSRTLILEMWCLRGALEHACAAGLLTSVPRIPRFPDRDRRPHKYLSEEESRALLAAMRPPVEQPDVTRGVPPLQYDDLSFVAVFMALNTGMRKGEVLTRRWEDVRWGKGPHGTLIVCARSEVDFRVKAGGERAIPLTPELRAELERLWSAAGRPRTGWIFPSKRDPSKPRKDFRSALRNACDRAGLDRLHPHALRHSWASRLAVAGVDRKSLMVLGGWSSGDMLDRVYAHVAPAHLADVMAKSGVGSGEPEEEP